MTNTIGDALFTKTQQRVLGLLYGQPGRSFYANEIVRNADMGRGTVRRELERLAAAGLLAVSREGNQQHYRANAQCPVYQEMIGIVRKTFGIVDVLRTALNPVYEQVDLAFIYGSIAKGVETSGSDIDLFIAADTLEYGDVMGLLTDREEILGRSVNPSIYSIKQIRKKVKEKNAFIVRILKQPKLWLKGSEDDIRGIG